MDGTGILLHPRSENGTGEEEESWFPGVGRVNVTTDGYVDDAGGRCWNVTFSSAVGAVGPMTVPTASSAPTLPPLGQQGRLNGNKLSGNGAAVTVETLQVGNTMTGSFSLSLGGQKTDKLAVMAPATAISEALMKLPGVMFAHTIRTNPISSCSNGLCSVGQTHEGGLEWTVEIGTRVGNTEPSSPTVAVGGLGGGVGKAEEGDFEWPEVAGYLEGDGATVVVRKGWAGSADQLSATFNVSQPFSIALGGVGASHGECVHSTLWSAV